MGLELGTEGATLHTLDCSPRHACCRCGAPHAHPRGGHSLAHLCPSLPLHPRARAHTHVNTTACRPSLPPELPTQHDRFPFTSREWADRPCAPCSSVSRPRGRFPGQFITLGERELARASRLRSTVGSSRQRPPETPGAVGIFLGSQPRCTVPRACCGPRGRGWPGKPAFEPSLRGVSWWSWGPGAVVTAPRVPPAGPRSGVRGPCGLSPSQSLTGAPTLRPPEFSRAFIQEPRLFPPHCSGPVLTDPGPRAFRGRQCGQGPGRRGGLQGSADPQAVSTLPLHHHQGLGSPKPLPSQGLRASDLVCADDDQVAPRSPSPPSSALASGAVK